MNTVRLAPLLLTLVATGGCLSPTVGEMPRLAHAEVASDFETYELYRVGLLPFGGKDVGRKRGEDLQLACLAEFSSAAPYELVLLNGRDLEEIDRSEPYRRGWYDPEEIIGISRRYNLDAILFGTIVQVRDFPPQVLSLQVDLVSAETGLVIWSSSVHLDAADQRVRDGLRLYYEGRHPDENAPDWSVSLLSPERFSRFAAFQIASLL